MRDSTRTTLWFDRIDTRGYGAPFAEILIAVDHRQLCALDFAGFEARMHGLLAKRYERYDFEEKSNPCGFADLVHAYLNGEVTALEGIPVSTGGTEFQQQAWAALRRIPAGRTATYGEQAARIGRPRAVRAIGAANGQNPVAIVVPCHRVIGSSNQLTGYAGGLAAKRWLLNHEGAL